MGLETVATFITAKKDTELYFQLEASINSLGDVNSTMNLYSRVVKLVSYFENLIIPKNNLKGKGQTYLNKNIIPKILDLEKEKLVVVVNKIYNIRDKYIHNKIELPIDANDLYSMKRFALIFLLHNIKLNDTCNTLDDLYNHFGISAGAR